MEELLNGKEVTIIDINNNRTTGIIKVFVIIGMKRFCKVAVNEIIIYIAQDKIVAIIPLN